MARGNIAKEAVIATIKEAFGGKFLGEKDKKYYVVADDGENGAVQIAISLTCPKVGLDIEGNGFVDDTGLMGTYTGEPVIEITPEEEENIQTLIKKLNI